MTFESQTKYEIFLKVEKANTDKGGLTQFWEHLTLIPWCPKIPNVNNIVI